MGADDRTALLVAAYYGEHKLVQKLLEKGARIEAAGTRDNPIVFTSQLPEGERGAGDWGGVILLGNAPINEAGGTAASGLLGLNEGIGRLRNRFHDLDGTPVMVTYHPSYLLRNPAAKRDVWEDMKRLLTAMGIAFPALCLLLESENLMHYSGRVVTVRELLGG